MEQESTDKNEVSPGQLKKHRLSNGTTDKDSPIQNGGTNGIANDGDHLNGTKVVNGDSHSDEDESKSQDHMETGKTDNVNDMEVDGQEKNMDIKGVETEKMDSTSEEMMDIKDDSDKETAKEQAETNGDQSMQDENEIKESEDVDDKIKDSDTANKDEKEETEGKGEEEEPAGKDVKEESEGKDKDEFKGKDQDESEGKNKDESDGKKEPEGNPEKEESEVKHEKEESEVKGEKEESERKDKKEKLEGDDKEDPAIKDEKNNSEVKDEIEGMDKKDQPDVKDSDDSKEKSKSDEGSEPEVIEVPTDKDEKKNEGESKVPNGEVKDDSANNDDIEIVGESKAVNISGPLASNAGTQNLLFIPANVSGTNAGKLPPAVRPGLQSPNLLAQKLQKVQGSPSFLPLGNSSLPPGLVISGATGSPSNSSAVSPALAPPKPKSSLDQIELIRWEIHNRVNTRPKYFKPNSSSELGPLAKFLYDIGSDLTKESVYHELVKIQSKKKEDDKLSEKEQEDLEKLKDIEKDLFATIGHLKLKMKKRCKGCHFQTESTNVMYLHKQYPHEVDKYLNCAYCKFSSKQPTAFKFHLESEHNVPPKMPDKKAFYECDSCPYENNQEQKVVIHKQRCIKQFRPHFNLHPSCLSGAEINLCLENIFYKPVIPKGLKILQQKHAQQQAALAEARRQQAQAQAQALAAQKAQAAAKAQAAQKAQAQAQVKKQLAQLQQVQRFPHIAPRGQQPNTISPRGTGRGSRAVRPTVANMLNNRLPPPGQGPPPPLPSGKAHGGFEVCEICGGYVKDRKALRIHFFYAHRIDLPFNLFERQLAPLYCATCYVRFWTAQGLRKHIETHKEENATTGVVGKCISCGHHVLNLLIHMRIVHNREIQHYINALMCMFCGMHFGSRNDVESHIKTVHGIVDPQTGAIKSGQNTKSTPNQKGSKKSGTPAKGSVCVLCNLNFGRNVDLTRHCMKMHHTCMKCGMVVIDKASLMKHTCLSSASGIRDCTMCGETGFHPAYFVKHLRDKHLKKFSIKVARLSKDTIERWTKCPYDADAKVCVEILDSSDDDDEKPREPPAKKPRMGPASFMKKMSQEEKEKVVEIEDDDDESEEKKNTSEKEKPDEKKDNTESPRKRKIGPLSYTNKMKKQEQDSS